MTRQATQLIRLLLLCLAAFVLVQCQRQEPKSKEELAKQKEASPAPGKVGEQPSTSQPAATPEPVVQDPLARAFPAGPSAFDNLEALKYLPPETPMLMVAANPQELLERLGRERLTKTFAQYYEMAVAEVTQAVGENVLVPKNLPNVGIDPTGTAGFAMFQFHRPVGVAFWSLTDADRFKTTIYSVAGRVREKMEPHVSGDATVICPRNDEEVCFIVKGNLAFVHFADMKDEEALALALKFGARSADLPSLATSETFQQTIKELAFGKDAALYIDTPAMLKSVLGAGNQWATESLADSEQRLKEARESEDKSEVEYWETRVKSDRDWAERERKKQAAEKELFESILSGTGTVAMGVELAEKSLRFKSFTHVGADSRWAALARPVKGPSPVVAYTPQRPFYLVHLNVDLKGYLELIDLMLAAEEMSVAKLGDQIRGFAGFNLLEDVLAILSGDIGFAVFGDLEEILSGELEGFKAVGGTVVLGLTDVEQATATLEKAFAMDIAKAFVKSTGEKAWQILVPEWRTVLLVVVEGYLVVTTDPEFITAFKSKSRRSFVDKLDNEELASLLSLEESTGVAAMDFGAFATFFVGLARSSGNWEVAEPVAETDVPYSDEYKRLKKETTELRAKARKRRDEIEAETNKRIGQMMSRIGVTAMVGVKSGDSFYGYGGHYIEDESIAALVEHLIQDGIAIEELQSGRRKDVWEMEDKAYELELKMEVVRTQTLAEAEAEKYRKAVEEEPDAETEDDGDIDAEKRAEKEAYLKKHGIVLGGVLVEGTVEDPLKEQVILDEAAVAAEPTIAP